jgi:hypothetical protein
MAHAQTAVDPAAPTPTVPYRSVFVDTPKGVETETVDWIAANAQVAQFPRGHIDLLKWEAAQAKAKASAETPAAPATTDTRQP